MLQEIHGKIKSRSRNHIINSHPLNNKLNHLNNPLPTPLEFPQEVILNELTDEDMRELDLGDLDL